MSRTRRRGGANLLINVELSGQPARLSRAARLRRGAYGFDRWKAGAAAARSLVQRTVRSRSLGLSIRSSISRKRRADRARQFRRPHPDILRSRTCPAVIVGHDRRDDGAITAGRGRRSVTRHAGCVGDGPRLPCACTATGASTFVRPKLELGSVATPWRGRLARMPRRCAAGAITSGLPAASRRDRRRCFGQRNGAANVDRHPVAASRAACERAPTFTTERFLMGERHRRRVTRSRFYDPAAPHGRSSRRHRRQRCPASGPPLWSLRFQAATSSRRGRHGRPLHLGSTASIGLHGGAVTWSPPQRCRFRTLPRRSCSPMKAASSSSLRPGRRDEVRHHPRNARQDAAKRVTIEDVRRLSKAEAARSTAGSIGMRSGLTRLPAGVSLAVFDFAVNSGPGRAVRAAANAARNARSTVSSDRHTIEAAGRADPPDLICAPDPGAPRLPLSPRHLAGLRTRMAQAGSRRRAGARFGSPPHRHFHERNPHDRFQDHPVQPHRLGELRSASRRSSSAFSASTPPASKAGAFAEAIVQIVAAGSFIASTVFRIVATKQISEIVRSMLHSGFVQCRRKGLPMRLAFLIIALSGVVLEDWTACGARPERRGRPRKLPAAPRDAGGRRRQGVVAPASAVMTARQQVPNAEWCGPTFAIATTLWSTSSWPCKRTVVSCKSRSTAVRPREIRPLETRARRDSPDLVCCVVACSMVYWRRFRRRPAS